MIHVDTNVLVVLPTWLRTRHATSNRLAAGEPLSISAQAWYEFACGPVEAEQLDEALLLAEGRVLPFGREQAEIAAQLYNLTGRKRSLQTDALVAAAAIHEHADLVTFNVQDFEAFVPHGLKLLPA